ncbi:MAG: NADH dehydrogenase (quinone) subunit D [Candidatus Marinimicrobia bacterium]|nr:NADH dehydrogenase (quinone) subunit D [Candidatus Neomarinimicrobiota bacterium]
MTLTAKELSTEKLELNFGPSHPATHGTLRVQLEADGEIVTRADAEIGFLHSGFEKLGEHLSYNQYITITDRMNYLSPLCNNVAFALAVEKLLGIEAPRRAQYLRVLMCELSRIADHLLAIGMLAVDVGAFTVFLYGFRIREKIYDLFEMVCGARLTTSYTRVGGLMRDVPDDFDAVCREVLAEIPAAMEQIDGLLTHNRIWLDRTRNIGVITPEQAISYGLTGPIARATGIDYDIRVKEPYSCYEDFTFDVIIGENGDVYDRYMVRFYEVWESIKICEQVLDKLPSGPVNVDADTKYTLPPRNEIFNSIEALIHHFEVTMENRGFTPPVGETYVPTESPNGELGYFIVSDGGREPYRVRTRPPSLINFSVFPEIMPGQTISDIVAVLGSLNIIAGELDR